MTKTKTVIRDRLGSDWSQHDRLTEKDNDLMCEMFAGQKPGNYQFLTRSIRLNGQSTSVRLERKFWIILDEIAESESVSTPKFLSQIHTEVVALHGEASNFASLLRCACLVYLEKQTQTLTT